MDRRAESRDRRRPGAFVVALVALVCGASVALFAAAVQAEVRNLRPRRPAPAPATPVTGDDAAVRADLLNRFEQGLRASWYGEFNFDRALTNGRTLAASEAQANRPPDSVIAALGGISGVREGRAIACQDVNGRQVCAATGPAASLEDAIAAKLANLRDALEPPNHWYRVERARPETIAGERASCFGLVRIVAVPAPPFGERTRLCFGRDGVVLRNRVERVEGVDERRATLVRHEVTDADFDRLLAGA